MKSAFLIAASILVAALSCGLAVAGPGHDHDHGDEAPATTAGPAAPRFESHSELFEVVGVLEGEELNVYVDRYADNAPVLKARVELESGAFKAIGEFRERTGAYAFAGGAFAEAGSYPVTLTVTAGEDLDMLAANLTVGAGDAGHHHEETHRPGRAIWLAGAGLLALVFLVFALLKRRRAGGLK